MKQEIDGIDYSKKVFGLVTGRFQPLHYGHFEFVDIALDYVDHLYIGITNPIDFNSANHKSNCDLNRNENSSNIFFFAERKKMIDQLFRRYFPTAENSVIPFDFYRTLEIITDLPKNIIIFHTVYDTWSEEKVSILNTTNQIIHILWNRKEKITTGSEVRKRIIEGNEWRHLVPKSTKDVIDSIDLTEFRKRVLG